jgi:regulator of sigma E protease
MMTLIAFIVMIGILVTIHEYGHFQVARWCGVRVLRFSIGFGKPLWKKIFGKDNTEFVLAAIPLGGFVKMLDEGELKAERESNPQESAINLSETELQRAFNRQRVWKRFAIVLAGPAANLLLAIVLYWGLFMLGVTGIRPIIGEVTDNSLAAQASLKAGEVIQKIDGKPVKSWQDARWILLEQSFEAKTVEIEAVNNNNELFQHTLSLEGVNNDTETDILKKIGLDMVKPNIPAVISEILPDSVAEKTGFMPNDKILRIDGVEITNWEQAVNTIKDNPNKKLLFEIERAQKVLHISAAPEAIKEDNRTIGRMGAAVKLDKKELDNLLIELNYSPFASLQKAVVKTWDTSIFSLKMLGKMVTGKVSLKGISGPVTIAAYAGESANLGIKTFLGFLALVSTSIGVLNLLPIPVLDGGHLMYYMVEIFKGSPVSETTTLVGQKIGFVLLGLLMTIALFNDLNRLIAS